MKQLLSISLLAVHLSSSAMIHQWPHIRHVVSCDATWTNIIQEFYSGTLTEQSVSQTHAQHAVDIACKLLITANRLAIISAIQATIAKGAAATEQERENARAGILLLAAVEIED